jgi:hypothetical protein
VYCQVHVGLVVGLEERCTAVADIIRVNSVPEKDVQIAVAAAATGGHPYAALRSDIGCS